MQANINKEEQRARLDEIFAQVEAELNGIPFVPQPRSRNQHEQDELNRQAKEMRLKAQEHNQMISNVSSMLKDGAFRTMWERVLAEKYVDLYNSIPKKAINLGNMNTELNLLRNFSNAVALHLERAERSAREQDNHHYYKIFTETVKGLLDKL